MFNYLKKNNKNIIKGCIVIGISKKVIIVFLGMIFLMKVINLNNLINNKKNFYVRKNKKKFLKYKNFWNIKIKKFIRFYKLRYLNFKIERNKKKYIFLCILYLDDIIKYLLIKKLKKRMFLERKKKKSNFFRKGYVKK